MFLHFLYPPFLILAKSLGLKIVIDSGFLIRNFSSFILMMTCWFLKKKFSFPCISARVSV